MADKLPERALVDVARKLYPWFPHGELVDHMSDAEASACAWIEFVRTHDCGTYEMLDGISSRFQCDSDR